jgi:hypothetical protein
MFTDLATVTFKRGDKVDILTEFTNNVNCSNPQVTPTSNNCTMDDDFRQAVTQQLTIREALDKNLLYGDRKVGAVGVKDTNTDYSSRYSLTNIKKLRRARIVPLGLEIAAQKISTILPDSGYTLKQVVDGFNDNTSPFYHLVDPDWVLKAPDLRCDMMAYSAVPVNGTNQRQQACVDMKDCISENDKGECLAYGYCTREKNIWVMGGDQCDLQYNTCQNYVRTIDHYDASYLTLTLDFSTCDQNSAGCKWYCQRFALSLGANNQDTWACKQPGTSLKKSGNNWREYSDPQNALYFNRQVEACASGSEGCSQWISAMPNSGANLLPNGSFEEYEGSLTGQGGHPLSVNGWSIPNNPSINHSAFVVNKDLAKNSTVVAQIMPGEENYWGQFVGIQFTPGDLLSNWPKFLIDNYSYTVSVAVNNQTDNPQDIGLFTDNSATPIYQTSVVKRSGWQIISYTFTQPLVIGGQNINWTTLRWGVGHDRNIVNQYVYFDSLQLEARQNASTYKDYGSSGQLYFKKAPDYLKCYNRNNGVLATGDDEVACSNYAVACNRDEVGCDLYRPGNGDPSLPAVARDADRCPASCVGYQTFRESDTNFSDGRLAVNLIPSTGRTCPANENGCSEFTNLDAVQKGGEGKEYYSYIRPCRQPDNACSYYYTWVGSDTTGYQLQRYYLEKSGTGAGPDGVLSPDQAAKLWGACNGINDVLTNPHCKQFYDNTGASYFMLYDNTISCSNDCHPLRKTTLVTANYCPTQSQSGVLIPGAVWQPQGNGIPVMGVCTYMAIPGEGTTCSKVNDGCRGYKGNAAYNVRQVFLDDFEGSSSLWTGDSSLSLNPHSADSTYVGGHSLSVTAPTRREVGIARDVTGLIAVGRAYQISFWIKSATNRVLIDITGNGTSNPVSLSNTDKWQLVTIGPYYVTTLPSTNNIELTLSTTPNFFNDNGGGSYSYSIDNILLKETTNNIYLIQNSWTTPQACDYHYDAQGHPVPDSMIGCQSYTNRTNQTNYFRSFSSLCRQEAVGCEAMIDTHNSTNAFGSSFDFGGGATAAVSPDNIEYLINDSAKSCAASDKGCQRFGLPTLVRFSGQDYKVTGWSDQFLKNNPDFYTKKPLLCQATGMNCEEYLPQGSNAPVYFKDPLDGVCEYKENAGVGGAVTGWFKKGTSEPCYGYNNGVGDYTVKKFGIPGYLGLAGLCPKNQSGCKRFADPMDGKSYYYIDNNKLDKSSCQGASQKQGCVLLNDATQGTKIYSAQATYNKSMQNNSGLVGPVNCTAPANPQLNLLTYCSGDGKDTDYCTAPANPQLNLLTYCSGDGKDTDYCKYCYNASNPGSSLVNNTNTLLKVRHDRICGEWLYCGGSQTVWDRASGQNTEICDQLARCNQLVAGGSNSSLCYKKINSPTSTLSELIYTNRDVAWSGLDYSGYSLYNIYQPDSLVVKSYGWQCVGGSNSGNPCTSDFGCPDGYCDNNYNLTYLDPNLNPSQADQGIGGKTCAANNQCPSGQICQSTCEQNSDCSNGSTCSNGFCSNAVCVVPKTCRAYPQVDAPFEKKAGDLYDALNICRETDNASCQCFYKKIEYGQGSQIQYFNYKNTNNIPPGVCTSVSPSGNGKNYSIGDKCRLVADCGEEATGAVCSFATKNTTALGLRGYCLEPDMTKPDVLNACLTWWPSATSGDPDVNNYFTSAGYFPASNQGQVCESWMTPGEFKPDAWASGTGFFPDNNDTEYLCPIWDNTGQKTYFSYYRMDFSSLRDQCGGHWNGPGSYQKTWTLSKDQNDSSRIFSYNISNGYIGDQDSRFYSPNLNNITKSMIKDLFINVCADFGGGATWPGDCNDLNFINASGNGNILGCDYIEIEPSTGKNLCWRKMTFANAQNQDVDANCYYYSAYNTGTNNDHLGQDLTGQCENNDGTSICPTFIFEACFNGNQPSSRLTLARFKMLHPSNNKTSTVPIMSLFVRGFLFQFNSGCQYILNIAETGKPAPAFTNRVNNKKNYYDEAELIDGKTWSSVCSPAWAALRLESSSPSTLVVAATTSTCSSNLIDYGSIYTDVGQISHNLFIKDYTAWHFDEATFSYLNSAPSGYVYDRRSQGLPVNSPKIYSVNQNSQNGQYQLGTLGTITVGNTDHENIQRQQNYLANIKFYSIADDNHMPIRELIVDWGDASKSGNTNMMAKNHIDTCSNVCCDSAGNQVSPRTTCMTNNDCQGGQTCKLNFGDSSDACTNQFWQFSHTYTCSDQGTLELCSSSRTYNCWDGSACIFKPNVYVKDNWGWCSGINAYAGDGSCCGLFTTFCTASGVTGNPGTPFTGTIIITPSGSGGGGGGIMEKLQVTDDIISGQANGQNNGGQTQSGGGGAVQAPSSTPPGTGGSVGTAG